MNEPLDLNVKMQIPANPSAANQRLPNFDEPLYERNHWKDGENDGKPLNIYEQIRQELSWIRRIAIHGERQRMKIIQYDSDRTIAYGSSVENLNQKLITKLWLDTFKLVVNAGILMALIYIITTR